MNRWHFEVLPGTEQTSLATTPYPAPFLTIASFQL